MRPNDKKATQNDPVDVFLGKLGDRGKVEIKYQSFKKPLSDADFVRLMQALAQRPNVTSISISIKLNLAAVQQLCIFLNATPRITVLELDWAISRIPDEGVQCLADMLKKNATLKILRIMHCEVSDDGAEALAEALVQNQSLTELDLTNNPIADRGATALLKAITQNKTLKILTVDSTDISDALRQTLERERGALSSLIQALEMVPVDDPVAQEMEILKKKLQEINEKFRSFENKTESNINSLFQCQMELRNILQQFRAEYENDKQKNREQILALERSLEEKIIKAQDEIEKIRSEQERAEKEWAKNTSALEEKIKEQSELQQKLEAIQESTTAQVGEHQLEIQTIQQEMDERSDEIEQIKKSLSRTDQTVKNNQENILKILSGQQFGDTLKAAHAREIANCKKLEQLEQKINQHLETKPAKNTSDNVQQEQILIAEEKDLYEFYLDTIADLGNLLIATLALKSGRVGGALDAKTTIATGVISDAPLPGINTAVAVANVILDHVGQSEQKKQINPLKFIRINQIDELTELTAREFIIRYEEQLRALTPKGLKQMSAAFIKRIDLWISRPNNFLDMPLNSPAAFSQYLLLAVTKTPENIQGIMGKIDLETKEFSREWTEPGAMRRPGIKLLVHQSTGQHSYQFYSTDEKVKTPKDKQLRPDKYGYLLLNSLEELEDFKRETKFELKNSPNRIEAKVPLAGRSIRELGTSSSLPSSSTSSSSSSSSSSPSYRASQSNQTILPAPNARQQADAKERKRAVEENMRYN